MRRVADDRCREFDPCVNCSCGIGHPPMLAVYGSAEGRYLLAEEGEWVCIARCASTGRGFVEGDICGNPAVRWAGDVPLCMHHYKRIMGWVRDLEDAAMERSSRLHEQRLRQQEELTRQAIRLERERIAAIAEAKAESSVVYYIRRLSDGMIKIGFSTSISDRRASLRGEHGPLQVLLVLGGDRDDETEAHYHFRDYRIGRTEWFRPARPLLEWICETRENHTHPHVQPDDVLPVDDIRALTAAAPAKEDLRWDDRGVLQWPPETAAA